MDMFPTHLNKVTLSRQQLKIVEVMPTKVLKILIMAVALLQPIVHQLVGNNKAMPKQLQLNRAMISLHSNQVMEVLLAVHQQVMAKICPPNPAMLSMIQARFTQPPLAENFALVSR